MPDVISASALGPFADILSSIIESIIEVVLSTKNVFIEKKSFEELSAYLNRIVPLLKEINRKNINDSKCWENVLETLNRQILDARQLISECSKKNKVYLLMSCRSIAKRIENITREISRALTCIPLASLDVSSGIKEEIVQLIDRMRTAEFRAAIAEEEILEKIESGIQQRNVDRSYANNLLVLIAEAVGVSTESSALRREFEEFKNEIDNARLRKDQAEALQMDQIIALLERADAATSRQEKEKKYFTKRKSLGSQPLEPLLSFYCPITREVMTDPVETPSGHTFERSAIDKWLAEGNLCPMTSTPLNNTMLRPNKTLRQSIEEWKDRNTMITIASMKLKISSTEEEEVLNHLEQLRDLCEQREIHREWVIMEDYIPILIKLLGSKSRDIRNLVLEVLCVLAKDGDDAKERIAEVDKSLESIVRSLGRRIGERKSAVALLLELSNCKSVQESIGKVQGCILLLVTMSTCDDNKAAKDARDILENISFSDDNVILMARANYFKYLLQRLSSGCSDVKLRMAKTLGEMELTDHNKSCLFEEGVLHSLLSLLSHGEIEEKQAGVKALLNLSSLPKNGQEMIRQGVMRPLLDTLYRHSSSQSLRELVAATITSLAFSSANSETQVSLLDADEDIFELFSVVNLSGPAVQQSILQAFYAMCKSPFAASVKAKLAQCSAVQVLVQFCEHGNSDVRSDAVKLFCCLIENADEAMIQEHVEQKFIETLLKIIKTSQDEEEITSAMGIISNLPKSPQLSEWLFAAEGLPIIFSFLPEVKHKNPCKLQLVENAAGALCHFTVSINQQTQKIAGIVPKLVRLLDVGTSLTKERAAISLAQLSENSQTLCRPIQKRQGLWCFSAAQVELCPVHRGICTLETSFCLIEAGAVGPLVRVLADPDPGACEASLDALLTLIRDEKLQNGAKVLAEENAIPSMIKLLDSPSTRLQQKVLNSLERIFRLLEYKQKYGSSAQMPLVDLTQRGSSNIKSLAAKVLAQLNVLHDQSSYF
ncbi:PREDICTED: U-box domain-containing protein 44-like [Nicotiana attenuata]|uniref:RING-type E3 ubiquitin transferase n=1 Tax=Nicotiana attenuata TaxID=49451 RepID=A0A1J6JUD8_NICAT|nr:PREDICTED: U-box domain-containing protein 44-like [Nicotiana attenuata]XP_019239028.1 PREDICTED: U-box domain-containing protein 44-like [Nicotiana attenuata]OIT21330.1 u-box domain-containing protein 44 [Nicotiana attenuata]